MKVRKTKIVYSLSGLLLAFALIKPVIAHAQELPKQVIHLESGCSKWPGGNSEGKLLGVEYSYYLSSNFSLNGSFQCRTQKDLVMFTPSNSSYGFRQDTSIRLTTTRLRLGLNCRSSLIRNDKFEVLFSLGVYGDYLSVSKDNAGNLRYTYKISDMPGEGVKQNTRQLFMLGGLAQLQGNMTCNRNFTLGISPGLMMDTGGNTRPQLLLLLGKRF